MSFEKEKKKYATNHYTHYPKGEFPPFLAYAFRPMFLLLAPYIIISILLWSFTFAGYINLPFMDDPLTWHIYEMIFGVGSAGIIAFYLTGAPELFPGTIPLVGRQLVYIIGLWVLGRVSFWLIDFLGVYFVALTNIPLILWIILLVIKPVILDPKRNHLSLAYMLVILSLIQMWFFSAAASFITTPTMDILKVALGAFTILELIALRRVNMEAINELLEDENIDETFYSKAPRYNLSIFCITLYTAVEFFYPNNSILAWIAFACAASILGILNDFILKDHNILIKPFVIYMMSILVLMSLGYGFMGYDYLNDDIFALNHFRHFLTTGVFGLVFLMVMIIVSTVHTGRHIFTNFLTSLSVILIIISTFIRVFIPYYEEYSMQAYIISSILWIIPFIIYIKIFFPFLLKVRKDGLPG